MKNRSNGHQKLKAELEKLGEQLATARVETDRIAATRPSTERKLAEIGRQLAALNTELAEIARERKSDKR